MKRETFPVGDDQWETACTETIRLEDDMTPDQVRDVLQAGVSALINDGVARKDIRLDIEAEGYDDGYARVDYYWKGTRPANNIEIARETKSLDLRREARILRLREELARAEAES